MKELIMLRTDSRATKEQLAQYKKKYEESEAVHRAQEEAFNKTNDELRQKNWTRKTTINNLTTEVKNLEADKKRLSEECDSLESAYEKCSETIAGGKAKNASL